MQRLYTVGVAGMALGLAPARVLIFADGIDARLPSLVSLGGRRQALSASVNTATERAATVENDHCLDYHIDQAGHISVGTPSIAMLAGYDQYLLTAALWQIHHPPKFQLRLRLARRSFRQKLTA